VIIVHCFRCDDVIEATERSGPLWCDRCDDEVLGPPSPTGDRSVRWSSSGLRLAGQPDDEPDDFRFYRRRGTGGSLLAAGMLGLQQALFGPLDDEPVIEMSDDEPDDDDGVELHLDEDAPTESWIRFRD
jgi:hypothetical protein